MTVKRYFAATARDCLRKVKEDLGTDAIVVSNKSVRGGVEIAAMPASDSRASVSECVEQAQQVAAGGARHIAGFAAAAGGDYSVSRPTQMSRFKKQAAMHGLEDAMRPIASPWHPPRFEPSISRIGQPWSTSDATQAVAATHAPSGSTVAQDFTQEIQGIRNLLEKQLAGFAWGELSRASPTRAQLMTELLEQGFSGVLARRMTQDILPGVGIEEGRRHAAALLDRRLRLFDAESDLIKQGGVYALVGPTGVGKTTTAAKLAANCVVRHGADSVALITTDGYRIGAYEQLCIYGRILEVPVHAVADGEELRRTLAALKDKHLVLIDTVGRSPHDRLLVAQGAMIAVDAIKRLLLINATARGEALDDVIRAYGGESIAACIISKADESKLLAPAVDAIVRHALPIAYVANGQRVPEDLHLPIREYLLHRVFKRGQGHMAHRLKDEEVGMAMKWSNDDRQ